MALKIRLRQQGKRNRLSYRLVLTDSRYPRDGKYIEMLGWYNPHEAEDDKNLHVVGERISHWLQNGAILTEKARHLVARGAPEVLQKLRSCVCKKGEEKKCPKKRAAVKE